MILNVKDQKIGDEGELYVKEVLEKYLGEKLDKTEPWHNYDLKGENLYIEIKTRRCKSNKYKSLYFSKAKYDFIKKNPNYSYKFVYNLYDGIYLWNYNEADIFFSVGGRTDRGKNEIKTLCNIPTKLLKKVK